MIVSSARSWRFVGLRTTSSAKLTPAYGGVVVGGGLYVIIGYSPPNKAGAGRPTTLDLRTVPALGRDSCS